jgi:L-alanine-DL-glutamate epimerase-like enolase superfamily enzyme
VLAEPQAVVDGKMQLPAGHGLGVTLDRGRLDKLALESAQLP